jgi:hypothetical protein
MKEPRGETRGSHCDIYANSSGHLRLLQLARVGWRKFSALKLSMRLLPRPRLVGPSPGLSHLEPLCCSPTRFARNVLTDFLAGPNSPGMLRADSAAAMDLFVVLSGAAGCAAD